MCVLVFFLKRPYSLPTVSFEVLTSCVGGIRNETFGDYKRVRELSA